MKRETSSSGIHISPPQLTMSEEPSSHFVNTSAEPDVKVQIVPKESLQQTSQPVTTDYDPQMPPAVVPPRESSKEVTTETHERQLSGKGIVESTKEFLHSTEKAMQKAGENIKNIFTGHHKDEGKQTDDMKPGKVQSDATTAPVSAMPPASGIPTSTPTGPRPL